MTEVEFRLLIGHDEFGKDVQTRFISALSALTFCEQSEIKILSIHRGCIVVRLRMPDAAAKTFYTEYLKTLSKETRESAPPELIDFMKAFAVDNYTRYKHDIQIVIKPEPSKQAVIFVHGWNGNQDSFGEWPKIVREVHGCDARIYTYPSAAFKHSPSIVHVADALRNWVKNRLSETRLAFVAHSLGGLVVRRFMVASATSRQREDLNVERLVFVASPHNGAFAADVASKIIGLSSEQLNELANDSPVLLDLNKRWLTWVNDNVPKYAQIMSLYGTADSVVGPINAIGVDEDAIPILGKGHRDIVKPTSASDEIVLTVKRFLTEGGFIVPQEVQAEEAVSNVRAEAKEHGSRQSRE